MFGPWDCDCVTGSSDIVVVAFNTAIPTTLLSHDAADFHEPNRALVGLHRLETHQSARRANNTTPFKSSTASSWPYQDLGRVCRAGGTRGNRRVRNKSGCRTRRTSYRVGQG